MTPLMATYITVWICWNLRDRSSIGYLGAFFAVINYITFDIIERKPVKMSIFNFFENR